MRILFLLAALVFAAPARAADLVVDAASNFTIDATINGQPVRLRVDPETSGYIILNQAAVQRLGLRRSMLGSQTRIGPVRLTGGSKVAEVSIGGVTGDRRLVWLEDRAAVEGADGLIGPADMHYARVTFTLGPPRPGEAAFALPQRFERSYGLFHPLMLGDHEVRFQFSLIKPDTMATAGAGAHLAALNGGAWTGEAHDQVIEFGVIRPVRALRLERPVSLGGLLFGEMLVRTGDNRGNLSLPPEPDADPEEVVVTGASRQRARFNVTLGRARLGQCSSLVWDNGTRLLTFNCTNPAAP
ncbi:MAG TPA: hypothetical protein VLK25_04000 [Allosphingosinicella sp.]|nr:hypothetical protein [Allosphingosinicella sp.]